MEKITVVLVCNGIVDNKDLLHGFSSHPILAVDGGLLYLHQVGVKPSLIIGDLDSVDEEVLSQYPSVPVRKFPINKDFSDTEIAIRVAFDEMGADKVVMFGGFGKRVDHSLYNVALLRRYPEKLVMQSGQEEVFVLKGKTVLEPSLGSTISLIPLTDEVMDVTTRGLKWELEGATFSHKMMSLSNCTVAKKVEIDFSKGELLVCIAEVHRT